MTLKCAISFLILNIVFFKTYSQSNYTIPGAQQQPAYVFPIYFEEGGGQRDTLYLGYDSSATGYGVYGLPSIDTIFGVQKVPIDTTMFYATWTDEIYEIWGELKDSVYKANVSKVYIYTSHFPQWKIITFNNGILPLKISWDKQLFYSDSLPFIQNTSAPGAQGRFIIAYNGNIQISENGFVTTIPNQYYYTLVTDSVNLSWCTVVDSITISNYLNLPQSVRSGYIEFGIEQWTGIAVHATSPGVEDKFAVYPNPFRDVIYFRNSSFNGFPVFIKIYDTMGNLLRSYSDIVDNNYLLGLHDLSIGTYFLEIQVQGKTVRQIILKH